MAGLFIVLDGADGCGKTTQTRLLAQALEAKGIDVLVTHEPGDTRAGLRIREVLLDPATGDLDPLAEAFLFCADRVQHVNTVIRPALERGRTVVCDRYASATAVYQGYAGGLGFELAQELNAIATAGVEPDLLIVLDIALEQAADRMAQSQLDRIEQNGDDYHERVREGFLHYAELRGERARVVDGGRDVEDVHAEILEIVETTFGL